VLFWAGALALVVAVLRPFRSDLERVHVALVLLLVVLGASARGGRTVGVAASLGAFLVFDFFFLPPFGTLALTNPLDWVVLAAFLVTSIVAAELLHRQREATRRAQAEALKDALIASVSHDLRTPLATIKALAHEMRGLGDERTQVIEEQADRLDRYVADLLDLSRLNAGEMPVHVALNAVDDLLSAVVDETSGRIGERPLTVRIEPAARLLTGWFDLALSVRIVANLVENAHRYAAPGQPVEVIATERDARVLVSVLDRGPGIPPEDAGRIFDPFFRRPAARGGGAGIGLAAGRRMAELQSGTLTYAARDGGGSVFTLSVPAASLDDASGAARAADEFTKS
jgi:two-component system sensor histidine kinase KdpD